MPTLPPADDDAPAPAAAPPGADAPLLTGALDAARRRVHGARSAVGLVVVIGAALSAVGVVAFAALAHWVMAGRTQPVDEAVLRWLGAHRGAPWLQGLMVELTMLGTMTVVLVMSGWVALLLTLARHRLSAALLLWATVGAVVLNNVVKLVFDRPRPQVFPWATHAATTSFPSGHAMSAAAVYGTIAWVTARLAARRAVRRAIHAAALALVLVVCASRMYLGVHYPSDVLAGALLGTAWAAFCAAVLEAAARRRRDRPGAPPR